MLTRNSESYSALDDEADADLVDNGRNRSSANPTGLLDAANFWLLLRWRASLIAIVAVATVLAAAAALTMLPPKYKATSVVLVDPRQPRVTNTEAVISGIGADAAAVESQVEIIESSTLAKRVIKKLNLSQDPDFASPSLTDWIGDGLAAMLGTEAKTINETRANRLEYKFQSGLTVRRRGLTYVLEISYLSRDPAKAARLSSAVADAYLDDQRMAKSDMTARASDWLKERIEEMRERVRASENAVAAYKSANNLVDVTQGNKLINRQIEDLTQQLALTRSRTAEAGARLEQVLQATQRSLDPAALAEALQSQVIAAFRTQYAEAARMEAEYSALYGNRYPGLVGVRAQLADLRRQIDREITRIVSGIRNDFQAAKDREASLERELEKLKSQAVNLNDADVKLRELEREAQANRTIFEQFLNRGKETNEQQSLQIAEARIISPALVPLRPDRPPALMLLLAAGIAGGLLGIGLVLALEQMRRGFRSASEIQQFLSLPTIGILPQHADAAAIAPAAVSSVSPAASSSGATGTRAAPDSSVSPYAGNLRAIRARLRRSATSVRKEVLAVISALPGEGKSTFACNLALLSASSGVRTLLIDGDVYAATVSRVFDVKGPGLVEILDGKTTFWHAIKKDPATGLYVLGARDAAHARPDHDEVQGAALATFLRQHQPHFDLVIIDCPATLSCDTSAPFVEHADRAILVVEWERTDRQAVTEVLGSLGPHARKVAGVVLNKVSTKWHRLFENGRYVRYYKYAAGASH